MCLSFSASTDCEYRDVDLTQSFSLVRDGIANWYYFVGGVSSFRLFYDGCAWRFDGFAADLNLSYEIDTVATDVSCDFETLTLTGMLCYRDAPYLSLESGPLYLDYCEKCIPITVTVSNQACE
jgi:hypothetical protein